MVDTYGFCGERERREDVSKIKRFIKGGHRLLPHVSKNVTKKRSRPSMRSSAVKTEENATARSREGEHTDWCVYMGSAKIA